MKKLITFLLILFISSLSYAGDRDSVARTKFTETDGSPSGRPRLFKFDNGSLTKTSDREMSYTSNNSTTDSFYHRLDSANTPFTAAIQVQTAGGAGGFLLLADGVSYLLLADGVSKLILEGGVSIITIAGASITSDSGAISFGDEDLTTTGSVTVGNLTSSKGRIVNTTRVTTTYQALVSDNVIFANTDSGAYPITMPVGVEGQHIRITNIGANTLTVDGNGTETVMGELTQELSDGDTINLYYNETKGWY